MLKLTRAPVRDGENCYALPLPIVLMALDWPWLRLILRLISLAALGLNLTS